MSFATGLKTIVVATDLDGRSDAALEYVRKLATAYGARIVLAHGLDPLDYAAVDAVPGRVLKGLPEQARAALDQLTSDLLREGIHSHSEIRQGAVAQMLVDVARQYNAGLIVIGTKGIEGAGPVIVGAIERNEAAQAAFATAQSLAEVFDRPLVVVHARQAAEPLGADSTSLKEFGIEPGGKCPVRFEVKDGNPVDVMVDAIAQNHPSMLVAGVKRTSGTPGPHGTIFALLARSRVPVLCVPPEPEACTTQEAK